MFGVFGLPVLRTFLTCLVISPVLTIFSRHSSISALYVWVGSESNFR